jgi:hypothetical protein
MRKLHKLIMIFQFSSNLTSTIRQFSYHIKFPLQRVQIMIILRNWNTILFKTINLLKHIENDRTINLIISFFQFFPNNRDSIRVNLSNINILRQWTRYPRKHNMITSFPYLRKNFNGSISRLKTTPSIKQPLQSEKDNEFIALAHIL